MINKVTVMGNAVAKPELNTYKAANSGQDFTVTTGTIATNRYYTDTAGTRHEEKTFVDYKAFGRTAEVMAEYVEKGRSIHLTGHLDQEDWEVDGVTRRRHRLIIARDGFTFVPGNGKGANDNQIMLMGNIARKPEVTETPSGSKVCSFSLAMNRNYTTGAGDKKQDTCFIDVNLWGKQGELVAENVELGHPLYVIGRLRWRTWENENGDPRSKLDVFATNFQYIRPPNGAPAPVAAPAPAAAPDISVEETEEGIPF